MKIKEAIQRVQTLYSKGVESDDSRLSSRYIYNKLNTTRNMLLTQKLNKKQNIQEEHYSKIPCIELIEVNKNECSCLESLDNCKILRSKHKIPTLLSSLNTEEIKGLYSINGNVKFSRLDINAVTYFKDNKYTSNKIVYFMKDGYLYILGTNSIKAVTLIGLFEDILEIKRFNNLCDNLKCIDPLNTDFPISLSLFDTVIKIILEELNLFIKIPEDLTNDTKDSNKQQAK